MTPHDLVLMPCGLRFLGRQFPCSIGRGGVSGQKREGDGATPVGTHRVVGMLYRPDRLKAPAISTESATGETHRRHHISADGYYRGKKVIDTPDAGDND